MAYSTISKSTSYFNPVKYTGNGSSGRAVTSGFATDWVWIKNRGTTDDHVIFDILRGGTPYLYTNSSQAETTYSSQEVTFESTGVNVGSYQSINQNSGNMISYHWKAGGSGSANTDGSINSTVSVNTTAGFSVVSYTGTGSNATVGHGLGAVPRVVITKTGSSANNWAMYHAAGGNTRSFPLDLNTQPPTSSAYWNNTTPTSSVFTVSTGNDVNKSGDNMIAYCFAEKRGFSKFGAYSGFSNANGPFLYTGFKPKYVCVKCTSTTDHWVVDDTTRSPFNEANHTLYSNLSNAEYTAGAYGIDIVSNGIKIRNLDGNYSSNGRAYVWWAFAEEPLVGDNPVTAR